MPAGHLKEFAVNPYMPSETYMPSVYLWSAPENKLVGWTFNEIYILILEN